MSPLFATPEDLTAAGFSARRPSERAPISPTLDEVTQLASRQHGVVARWQAAHLGYAKSWIDDAVGRGLLHSLSDGIYAVGHTGLSRRGLAIAALLRAGPGSALSHASAARMWGLTPESTDGEIHVSLARRRGLASGQRSTLHRPRRLDDTDIVEHRGLPVTTPERTIRDLLATSTVEQITRMLEQAVTTLGRSPDELHAWSRTVKGAPGIGKLYRALDNVVGPAVLRSEFERRFRDLCQRAGLPLPETNVPLDRWELDGLWRELGVAVELDSWRWHGGRWQFHRDRRKGLAINRAGLELVRLTWAQVKHEEQEVVETLRLVLGRAARRRALEAAWAAHTGTIPVLAAQVV